MSHREGIEIGAPSKKFDVTTMGIGPGNMFIGTLESSAGSPTLSARAGESLRAPLRERDQALGLGSAGPALAAVDYEPLTRQADAQRTLIETVRLGAAQAAFVVGRS